MNLKTSTKFRSNQVSIGEADALETSGIVVESDKNADWNSKLAGWRLHQGWMKIYIWKFGLTQNLFPEIEKFSILDSVKTKLWWHFKHDSHVGDKVILD